MKLETKPEDGMSWNRVDLWVKNDDRISPVVTPRLARGVGEIRR